MAITIKIGSVNVDPRTLDKSGNFNASMPAEITAQIKENCSIMRPSFILSSPVVNLTGYNYCYVPDWGRYYYIDNIIVLTGVRCEIRCREDVLTSNADAIRGLTVSLRRSESNGNSKMSDALRAAQVNRQCETLILFDCDLGSGSDDIRYILTVQGGSHL